MTIETRLQVKTQALLKSFNELFEVLDQNGEEVTFLIEFKKSTTHPDNTFVLDVGGLPRVAHKKRLTVTRDV